MIKKLIVAAMLIATLGIGSVAYAQRAGGKHPKKTQNPDTPVKLPNPPNPKELMTGKVTKVTINKDLAKTIKCPSDVRVDGVITTNGPAAVKYQWIYVKDTKSYPYSKFETVQERTLTFGSAGSQNVSVTWLADEKPGFKVTPTLYLDILSPNNMRDAGVHFQCQQPKPLTGKVTAVKVASPPNIGATNCPELKFIGVITTNGPADVTYKWDGSISVPKHEQTLKFLSAGNKTVSVNVGGASEKDWVQLKVLSPNEVLSNKITYLHVCR
ncbi:MAG TPA: hypothetical protein VLQ90_10805 [Pyrinomonadaceae bacterium]|nr:hypothetical protein [Pyrinomonadaceae bacterium]